jgi:hypothetical protein
MPYASSIYQLAYDTDGSLQIIIVSTNITRGVINLGLFMAMTVNAKPSQGTSTSLSDQPDPFHGYTN